MWLADDIANDWVGSEGTNFIKYRSNRFVNLFFIPLAKFLFPELKNSNIGTVIEGFFAEIFICENTGNV